jgi:hypothetical protein
MIRRMLWGRQQPEAAVGGNLDFSTFFQGERCGGGLIAIPEQPENSAQSLDLTSRSVNNSSH